MNAEPTKLHAKAAAVLDVYRMEGLTDEEITQAVLYSGASENGILQYAEYSEIQSALDNGYVAKFSTQATSEPTCPHCGVVQTDWFDYIEMESTDQQFDYICESCDGEFAILMQTVFTTTTK